MKGRDTLSDHQPTKVDGPMSDVDPPKDPAHPDGHDAISFRDPSGALWWAHEVSGEALGSSRPTCLLLISTHQLRRIWTYPRDWRSRAPIELLALAEDPL